MEKSVTNRGSLLDSEDFVHHGFRRQSNSFGSDKAEQRTSIIVSAIVLAFFLVGAMVAPLCAQSYPNKPIRLIIPFPPGGGSDILGRIIGQKYSEQLHHLPCWE